MGDPVVDDPELRGVDIKEAANRAAATSGQSRIDGYGYREALIVGFRHRAVLRNHEVSENASEVADVQRQPRGKLMLHGCGEFPVVRPESPTVPKAGIDELLRLGASEELIAHRA